MSLLFRTHLDHSMEEKTIYPCRVHWHTHCLPMYDDPLIFCLCYLVNNFVNNDVLTSNSVTLMRIMRKPEWGQAALVCRCSGRVDGLWTYEYNGVPVHHQSCKVPWSITLIPGGRNSCLRHCTDQYHNQRLMPPQLIYRDKPSSGFTQRYFNMYHPATTIMLIPSLINVMLTKDMLNLNRRLAFTQTYVYHTPDKGC